MQEIFETSESLEEIAEALMDDAQIKLRMTKVPVNFTDDPQLMLALSTAESSLATSFLLKALIDRIDALAEGATDAES
jgi:hypothetical protein